MEHICNYVPNFQGLSTQHQIFAAQRCCSRGYLSRCIPASSTRIHAPTPALLWACATHRQPPRLCLVPRPNAGNTHAISTRQSSRNKEKESPYFILRNISYLFPLCSRFVPVLFPKLLIAPSKAFMRLPRPISFSKKPCSHVPKKNNVLRHFDATTAPCPCRHVGTKKPPRRAAGGWRCWPGPSWRAGACGPRCRPCARPGSRPTTA